MSDKPTPEEDREDLTRFGDWTPQTLKVVKKKGNGKR